MKNHTELLMATPSMCQSRDLLIHVLSSIFFPFSELQYYYCLVNLLSQKGLSRIVLIYFFCVVYYFYFIFNFINGVFLCDVLVQSSFRFFHFQLYIFFSLSHSIFVFLFPFSYQVLVGKIVGCS